jgi:hypothetical protein
LSANPLWSHSDTPSEAAAQGASGKGPRAKKLKC